MILAFVFIAFANLPCRQAGAMFAQSPITDPSLDYYLPDHHNYDPAIPSPEDILGFVPGKWHVSHTESLIYMYALAAASDRITIQDRGLTYEDRPLVLLTITAPENHQQLSSIKEEHKQAALGESSKGEDLPAIVYQGFSIHGNEASGANAALLLAYHLAASQSSEVMQILENTVILFDPAFNPDGMNRFASWVNMNKSAVQTADPQDREHDEPWPGGRTNHYWFDMNRDWLPVQLPESQARIATFHEWLPHILTDHHEMGTNSTFFFQPGIPSRTHPLTPVKNQELTKRIGEFHAAELNEIGSLYYTEEDYDDFYYGKGSTFPDVNGGIGILFEQASSRGHLQNSVNGPLSFPFTIRNQLKSGISTLKAAVALRTELQAYQRDFYRDAMKEADDKMIVFGSEEDPQRTDQLLEILLRHQIEVHHLKEDLSKNGKQFKSRYAYAVPTKQPKSRLVQAIFEKRTSFRDSLFYDISAWTFPMAMNLDYEEGLPTKIAAEQIELVDGNVEKTLERLKATRRGEDELTRSDYGYLIDWQAYHSPGMLYELLDRDLRVKVAMKPFSITGKDHARGTLFLPLQNQSMAGNEIYALLDSLSRKREISVTPVSTGLTKGIDLGSRQFRNLEKPKIALLTGSGVSSYDAGEIWHLMDQRYKIPVTKLEVGDLDRADLSRYNTIILPNFYGTIDERGTDALKNWVQNGGTLIAYKYGLRWLQRAKLANIAFKTAQRGDTTITFEQRRNASGAQRIGGAIFNVNLDRSHPIAFGYKRENLPVFRNTTLFLKPDAQSYDNPLLYDEQPLLSGYISEENLAALKGTSAMFHNSYGRGDVVGFTDNTQFRAFWFGTNKLLMNAIFFAEQM